MDDLIRNRNAKFAAFQQEIDTLKQNLSNHVKEKESLSTTLTVFKKESKEKESKYMDKKIVLENQNKELENILPLGILRNNKITQPPSRNQKNKVEEHPRNIKSSLKKKNSVSEPISNALVKHAVINAKVESMCAIYNKYLFDANHDMCLVDYVNDVNVHSKSKSKRNKMRKVWKPTGKVFTEIGYSWKPTRRIFTIAGNRLGAPSYGRKLFNSSNLSVNSCVPSSFGNDHIAKIMGYGDYQMGNVTISQILPKAVPDFATPMIKSTIIKSLEDVILAKSSSQPQSTYEAAASLTEAGMSNVKGGGDKGGCPLKLIRKKLLTRLHVKQAVDALIKVMDIYIDENCGLLKKARGVVVHEPSEFTTTTSQPSQLPQAKGKGKGKMVEPEKPLKRKDQVLVDEEIAQRLQEELQAEL
ncbi:hypothetical protein Tco_0904745 [Tanacetum coccineum]